MTPLRRIRVAGRGSFEYLSRGAGRSTLLVHSGGPGLTFHYLRRLLRLANRNLRVVLYNPRGVGGSWAPRRASAYTVANLAEDVEAIRRALRVRELHLLGYSAGGFVALEYAHRHGENLASLLLCSTAGSGEEVDRANHRMIAAASPAQRARLRALTRARVFSDPEYIALSEAIAKPFQSRFLARVPADLKATKPSPRVYRAMMTRTGDEFAVDGSIGRWDGRRYCSRLRVPTLVAVGRYDSLYDSSVTMGRRIPGARLRVFPRSSHLPIFEQPQEFLGTIRTFLRDLPSVGRSPRAGPKAV